MDKSKENEMSQFRSYTLHLLDGYFVEGISLTSKNTAGVVEIAALEAAQKELEQVQKDKASNDADYLKLAAENNSLRKEKQSLTAALKVAEDQLEYVKTYLIDGHIVEGTIAEIQKIKKGLG